MAVKEAESVADTFKASHAAKLPEGAKLLNHDDATKMYLCGTWKPALAVTGAAGLPNIKRAGNVLRASTTLTLSLHLPPNADAASSLELLKTKLSTDVPYGCHVNFDNLKHHNGWTFTQKDAPAVQGLMSECSKDFFGADVATAGKGGGNTNVMRL